MAVKSIKKSLDPTCFKKVEEIFGDRLHASLETCRFIKGLWDYMLTFWDCDDLFLVCNVMTLDACNWTSHMLSDHKALLLDIPGAQEKCEISHKADYYECPHRTTQRCYFYFVRRYRCCEVDTTAALNLCFVCYTYGIGTFVRQHNRLPFLRCDGITVCDILQYWYCDLNKQLMWSQSRWFHLWFAWQQIPKTFYCLYYSDEENKKLFENVLALFSNSQP